MSNADHQYAAILRAILGHGDDRIERTGVGTKSVFGVSARFDLSGGEIPLLTTKRMSWKAAVKEMLWFLTGETNIRPLVAGKVSMDRRLAPGQVPAGDGRAAVAG